MPKQTISYMRPSKTMAILNLGLWGCKSMGSKELESQGTMRTPEEQLFLTNFGLFNFQEHTG